MTHSIRRLHDWSQFDAVLDDGSGISILLTPEKRRYDISPNDALADRIVAHVENHFGRHRSDDAKTDWLFDVLSEAAARPDRLGFATHLQTLLGTDKILVPRGRLASPPSISVKRGEMPKFVAKFANHEYLSIDVGPSGPRIESDPELDTATRRIVSFLAGCRTEGLETVEAFDALAERARASSGIAETADRAMEHLANLPAVRARFEADLAVPMVLPGTDDAKIRAVASVVVEALDLRGVVPTSGLVSRIMLLADAEHMRSYGRPTAFENYRTSQAGPVSETISSIVPNADARIRRSDLGPLRDLDEELSRSDFQILTGLVDEHVRTAGKSTEEGCRTNKAVLHAAAKGLDRLDYRLIAPGTPAEILENVMIVAASFAPDPDAAPRF